MSKELRICPGVGGRKCGAFLSSLDRDPHPTCARCRGKICTKDMTCDFCVNWCPAQWELFAMKCSYKDRKKSRPSSSVPPAPGASPARELLRTFRSPGLPPLLPALQGAGSLGVHLMLRPVGLPPLPLDLGPARGVEVSLDVRLLRASVSSAPSGAAEGEVARLQRTLLARSTSSVASPCSSRHALRCDERRDASVDRSSSRSSRVSRSSDGGTRKDCGARSRSDSSRDHDRRSRSRSAYRSRSRASEAVILLVAILQRTVAIFGSLPFTSCALALSLSGRPVSILGSILVSPGPLSA